MSGHDVHLTDDVRIDLLDGGAFPLETAGDRDATPIRDFLTREFGNPMPAGNTLREP